MPRRVVVVLLQPVLWHPPGVSLARWRAALAEDVVDLIATLDGTDAAIAAPVSVGGLAKAVAWPRMPVYELAPPAPTVVDVLAAAAADGYDEAAVLVPDAPDLPALLVGKLMRPLTSRTAVAAPAFVPRSAGAAGGGAGLLGVACRLPAPGWFPGIDLDGGSAAALRAAAPRPDDVATSPGWRRLRDAQSLATLDPALEGWEATRALLAP